MLHVSEPCLKGTSTFGEGVKGGSLEEAAEPLDDVGNVENCLPRHRHICTFVSKIRGWSTFGSVG